MKKMPIENIKKSTEEVETKKPEKDWEQQIDLWVEEKIQKELGKIIKEKYKGRDEKIISEMKNDWQNRVAAENNLKIKLKKILPRAFQNFAVHGSPAVNAEGKRIIAQRTDLDAKTCLGLIELATNDSSDYKKNISFVDFPEHTPATVHLDVGQYDGVALLKEIDGQLETIDLSEKEKIAQINKHDFFLKLGLIIDHHPESETPSAASMLFKILNKLALLDNYKEIKPGDKIKLRKMIEFVNIVDSYGFQAVGTSENFPKSDRTLLGLNRFLNFKALWNYFKYTDGDFNRVLSDEELKKLGLIYIDNKGKVVNRQEQQRKVIDSSLEKIQELKKDGFIIKTNFGQIVIDVDSKLGGGAFVAQSIGAGYLKWDSKNNTLYLFVNKELPQDLFDYGVRVRKLSWVMPAGVGRTSLGLKGVIDRLGGQVVAGSKLEEYLKQD